MPAVPAHSDSAQDAESSLTWIKADFHLHTSEDPFDDVDYTALELLELAHARGFHALAVTLHREVFHDERAFARARELGILLIPAAELRIEGADVVVLNITPEEAAQVHSFDDLRDLRAARGNDIFAFAPHPYYVLGGSIGERAEEHIDCFDAIEFCHFHLPLLNPNRRAARLAQAHGKPLLATSDSHRRQFFGRNYSLIGVEGSPEPDGRPAVAQVFAGMRAQRIQRICPTGGLPRLVALLFFVLVVSPILRRLPGSKRTAARRMQAWRDAQGELLARGAPQTDSSANL
jgi:predicted metal-dependent phosphoesterase TrpH